ncbi:Arabinose 5-phosphate isomerase [Caenispirillum salinarum AK4]|uniref:Arabinose 5-phosphate isomerase n=1 Tax=Caenispirillum salinarum AK4 TaxID=1238182 RepID=K9H4H5_9PROT|nr:KpsF/GutQ family sugar-phosphate isomerase [Caenispirillum salinarum]EKV31989.1 Arabinose 5-phosphate isomerase [Caenispirillum salinarum AK4]
MQHTAKTTEASSTAASPDIASARRVLGLEAEGLTALAQSLGETFQKAVDVLDATEGRIIVSGMGKSGHVGRKIAATLASTGRPAQFVHPGEASHGDMGMITRADAVIALSNSGETPELADLIGYTRRFDIPLVAMTSRETSTLATQADAALVLPRVNEACPLGLAPTTSTTMMLALGDALSVCLLERKGFTAADFQIFHPGGQLGRRLLTVRDLMHTGARLPLIAPDAPMSEAIVEMSAKSFGCVGVLDGDGRLAGIVTDGDLRRHMSDALLAQRVGDVMTPGPKTIRSSALAAEALRILNTMAVTSLFVLEDDKPVGLIHIHDCLRAGVA